MMLGSQPTIARSRRQRARTVAAAVHAAADDQRVQLFRHGPAASRFDLSCDECPDLDADDRLTVFDYLEFMRAFEAGEPIADFDNDGELTVADFLAFQDAFAVGCP